MSALSPSKPRRRAKKSGLIEWLERRWLSFSFAGGVLFGISICLFAAALNTMAGWLYVISGTMFAILIIAAIEVLRSLKNLKLRRSPILPVSAGDVLTLEVEIENPTPKPRNLLQVQDMLPFVLGQPIRGPVEVIPPKSVYRWQYEYPTQKRGVYRWHEVELRSGTPLGLFWCRRSWNVPAKAIVYPMVFPLSRCPLIDNIGQEENKDRDSDRHFLAATEGLTKALRPYRMGDPIRLVHWRSSARFGELKVRELETITGGQDVVICLDSASSWEEDRFEQAVIAAASLYFYASKQQMNVKLWTAYTGLIKGHHVVLEALAATYPREESLATLPENIPLIWLTQNSLRINDLPGGSRWALFSTAATPVNPNFSGLVINEEEPLQTELQKPLK